MAKEFQVLLKKLAAYEEAVPQLYYDYEKSSSDVADIFRMQDKKDVEGLIDFWNRNISHGYFELSHPFKPVITRAIYNIQFNAANFVFMLDEDNKNLWVMVQNELLASSFITQDGIYKSSEGRIGFDPSLIENFSNIDDRHVSFKNVRFGFLMTQIRPYHYFYDHLKFLFSLRGEKVVRGQRTFFQSEGVRLLDDGERVLLFPSVIGNQYLNQKNSGVVKKLNESMEDIVFQESVDGAEEVLEEGEAYDLVLWIGITGQKRSWLQQTEGYVEVVKELRKYFSRVKVYVDGMTAADGEEVVNIEDEAVFSEIDGLLKKEKGVELVSLVGKDYRTKIAYCDRVDFFIANGGTGCMVPLRINKKPGVLHSNSKLFTFPDEYPDVVKKVSGEFVLDVAGRVSGRDDFLSYHTPWQHIFNLTAEVANKIKGTDIQPIDVPPVLEVAKQYDLQEKKRRQEVIAFEDIERKIKPFSKSPDILREVALSFERFGDVETALTIMYKALNLRPNGPFIRKKVIEYQAIIESANQKKVKR